MPYENQDMEVTKRCALEDERQAIIEMNVDKPAKWSFQTAAAMANIASKLPRCRFRQSTPRSESHER